jgi:Ser/Thr protein kinase RdoA (MazF antagonist)
MSEALGRVPKAALAADPEINAGELQHLCAGLTARALRAAENASGIQSLEQGVVHGDLHPGNVLFEKGRLQAILDFDGARMDWRACEIANAALHFGNDPVSGTDVEEWDPALDAKRVHALVAGVEHGMAEPLLPVERSALPWLMIEACTLESVVPIVRTGRFAHLRADKLLRFVDRKAAWIQEHAGEF